MPSLALFRFGGRWAVLAGLRFARSSPFHQTWSHFEASRRLLRFEYISCDRSIRLVRIECPINFHIVHVTAQQYVATGRGVKQMPLVTAKRCVSSAETRKAALAKHSTEDERISFSTGGVIRKC